MGMAKESRLDAQNRISLTDDQRSYAALDKDVLFAGEGRTVGLWNPDTYEKLYGISQEESLDGFEELFYWDNELDGKNE
jgi:DNA-binding transcriptional regulator/RsmH inhibitor MraZ